MSADAPAAVRLALAASPTSWGVDFADAPTNPGWERVLDDIARSGLGWLELGPVGYLPEDPEALADALASRGLRAVGTFVFQPLHRREALPDVLAVTRRTCRVARAAGGERLVVIDLVSDARASTAGRPDAAVRLEPAAWRGLRDAVARVAELAREHGLRPVLHNHVGTFVELPDELEALLASFAPDELGACVDTGHAAYAGAAPEALLRRLGERVEHLHLKDVDPDVLALAVQRRASFWWAVRQGVFCPLGRGVVDLRELARALEAIGYAGPATIEQDGDPARADHALGDLRRSVEALGAAGIVAG